MKKYEISCTEFSGNRKIMKFLNLNSAGNSQKYRGKFQSISTEFSDFFIQYFWLDFHKISVMLWMVTCMVRFSERRPWINAQASCYIQTENQSCGSKLMVVQLWTCQCEFGFSTYSNRASPVIFIIKTCNLPIYLELD